MRNVDNVISCMNSGLLSEMCVCHDMRETWMKDNINNTFNISLKDID